MDEKGDTTTTELRQNLKTTLASIVRRVNAVAEMTEDTDEKAQEISDFIIKANGITGQYRRIIAQLRGSGDKQTPADENADDAESPS